MKRLVSILLRKLGLLQASDYFRYLMVRIRNAKLNKAFRLKYPNVILPPDYLMYESFKLNYSSYYLNGRKTAEWLVDLLEKHSSLAGKNILDWGCGPARVIRHLPDLIENANCFGTDYNKRSIQWCREHLPAIDFRKNGLMPPIDHANNSFDLVYGISIFTHLSAAAHDAWLEELKRVLKPGGILMLTLHGESFRAKLTPRESDEFDRGNLVIRGQVKEGHRTFTAFHPPIWVKHWASDFSLLDHIPGMAGEQDVWIFRL